MSKKSIDSVDELVMPEDFNDTSESRLSIGMSDLIDMYSGTTPTVADRLCAL